MSAVTLTHDPLSVDALLQRVHDPEHGGIAVFLGTTRREASRAEVVALEYDAYEELALTELRDIVAQAEALGARVAIAHRLGRVAVREVSVIVVASAPHRPQAFAACRLAIDETKHRVPIWKRAVLADGTAHWMDGVQAPAR